MSIVFFSIVVGSRLGAQCEIGQWHRLGHAIGQSDRTNAVWSDYCWFEMLVRGLNVPLVIATLLGGRHYGR